MTMSSGCGPFGGKADEEEALREEEEAEVVVVEAVV